MYNIICADERGEIVYTRPFDHKIVAMDYCNLMTAAKPIGREHDVCIVTYWDNDALKTTYTSREGKEVAE